MPTFSPNQIDTAASDLLERIEEITDRCTQPQLVKLDKALDELSYVVSDIETDIEEAESEDEEEDDSDDDE